MQCGYIHTVCRLTCSVYASMQWVCINAVYMLPCSVQASMLTYFIKGFQHWLLEIVLYNFLNWQSILCINTKVKKVSVFVALHNFNPSPIFERDLYDEVLKYSTL